MTGEGRVGLLSFISAAVQVFWIEECRGLMKEELILIYMCAFFPPPVFVFSQSLSGGFYVFYAYFNMSARRLLCLSLGYNITL